MQHMYRAGRFGFGGAAFVKSSGGGANEIGLVDFVGEGRL